MTAVLLPQGKQQYFTAAGVPLVGGKVFTYDTGTTTPRTTWADAAQASPNANPVILDARGEATIFWSGAYRVVVQDSLGNAIWTVDGVAVATDQLRSDLVNSASSVLGAALVGYNPALNYPAGTVGDWLNNFYDRTAAEIAAGVTPTNYFNPPGDIRRYGAIGDGATDCSTAILNACKQCISGGATVLIPGAASFYRCNSAIALTAGCNIRGDGTKPSIRFYGCDGFVLAQGQSLLTIQNLRILSYSGVGVADPKTNIGIDVNGVPGSFCTYVTVRDVFLRGWATCIDFSYTWQFALDTVDTLFCDRSVRLFGQSVNNTIANCNLDANTGIASIDTVKDGAIKGEGLMVSNCFIGEGTYGIRSDGFLSLNVSNCVIDLISIAGIDVTNAASLSVSNCWISAANFGINFNNLGVPVVVEGSINNCHIYTSAAGAKAIFVGAQNQGVNISGGSLTCPGAGADRCLYVESGADNCSMTGTHLINSGGNSSLFINATNFRHNALTGNVTITYNVTDQYTGTLTQCTTAPTAVVKYNVNGDLITLRIPALVAVSANVNQPLITGMPVAIRPLTQQVVSGFTVNNSVEAAGKIRIETNGDLTLYNGISAAFTAANNKGTADCIVTFNRNY